MNPDFKNASLTAKMLWCMYCGKDVDLKDIKPGTFKCQVCGRKVGYKRMMYPQGTILIWDEEEEDERVLEEIGRASNPQTSSARKDGALTAEEDDRVFHSIALAMCPEGCILVDGIEKEES